MMHLMIYFHYTFTNFSTSAKRKTICDFSAFSLRFFYAQTENVHWKRTLVSRRVIQFGHFSSKNVNRLFPAL